MLNHIGPTYGYIIIRIFQHAIRVNFFLVKDVSDESVSFLLVLVSGIFSLQRSYLLTSSIGGGIVLFPRLNYLSILKEFSLLAFGVDSLTATFIYI